MMDDADIEGPEAVRSVVYHEGRYIDVVTDSEMSSFWSMPEADQRDPVQVAAHQTWIVAVHAYRCVLFELLGRSELDPEEAMYVWDDLEWEEIPGAYREEARLQLAIQTGLTGVELDRELKRRL